MVDELSGSLTEFPKICGVFRDLRGYDVVLFNMILIDIFLGSGTQDGTGWAFGAGITECVDGYSLLITLRKLRDASLASLSLRNDIYVRRGSIYRPIEIWYAIETNGKDFL